VTDDAGNPLAAAFLSHAIEDAEVAKAIKVRLEAQAPLIIPIAKCPYRQPPENDYGYRFRSPEARLRIADSEGISRQ
jgi:hypothetical protein